MYSLEPKLLQGSANPLIPVYQNLTLPVHLPVRWSSLERFRFKQIHRHCERSEATQQGSNVQRGFWIASKLTLLAMTMCWVNSI